LIKASLYLNPVNKIRSIFYKERGKFIPPSQNKKWKNQAKKVMYAVGVSAKGATDLHFLPPTTKFDSWFFNNSILKPIQGKDVPRLNPGEEHKILNFDSLGSHTTPEVYG
jgi:hypothetical protein